MSSVEASLNIPHLRFNCEKFQTKIDDEKSKLY